MNKTYPIWALLFLAFCASGIVMAGGSLLWFMNVPSLVVVVGISFVLLLSNYSLPAMGRCFAVAYGDAPRERRDLEDGLAFFEAMQVYLLVAGVVGFLLGLITMLTSLTDAERIGSGTALALMTVLYGLILYIGLVVPFKTGVKRKLAKLG